jgi:hypothetical protein
LKVLFSFLFCTFYAIIWIYHILLNTLLRV